jgi:Bacterial pre-peptidase C-terminal domain
MLFVQRSTCFLTLAVVAAFAIQAGAQPPPANSSAPQIDIPIPLGARRGSTIDLALRGKNLADPIGLGLSFAATSKFLPAKPDATAGAALQVRLEIPTDAPLGLQSLRLATKRGISNVRLFCIDDLPEIAKRAGNSTTAKAQHVKQPAVVTGKAEKEASDYYRFTATAGERLVFEVIGRRLGSAFDPQITLFNAKSGKEMPGGHNNDAPGLQTDSRLVYTFKDAGDYVLEIRDTLWRGGDDYWYRLRIGDFPCATTPYPLSVRRGTQETISFAGSVASPSVPFELVAPTDDFVNALALTPRNALGLAGWPVFLGVSNLEERVEREPNNDLAHANRIAVPGAISGRLLETNDVDCFTFAAKKGQRLNIDVQSLEWNSPTEVYMVVKDAKGVQLAAGNPQVGQTIDFTAPADGDFTVVIEHLLTWNGPAETYRLVVVPHEPGFDLALTSDRIDIPIGGLAAIPVTVVRREFNGPIDLQIINPAGIRGHGVVPAGALAATLFVQASDDMPLGAYSLQVRGSANIGGRIVVQPARIRAQLMAALSGLPFPPQNLLDSAGIAVTEKSPFAIKFHIDAAEAIRGKPIPVIVELASGKAAETDIKLASVGLPAKITAALPVLAKGQKSVKGTVSAAADAPVGDHEFTVVGTSFVGGREFLALSPPATLALKAKSEATPAKP